MVTENRVQELAYSLWEQDGRPDGRNEEHYYKAIHILQEMEAVQPDTEAIEPAEKTPRRRATRSKKAETKAESTEAKPAARRRSTRTKKS